MKLIDAYGSYTLNAADNTDYSLCFGFGTIGVMDEHGHIVCEFDADDAPTVDAVPVVRCKDCKWWGNSMDWDGHIVGRCNFVEMVTDANGYCYRAEWKEV